ncbi:MAG: tRNA (adenosine(37)-N6)-threonylcarbamoyltransferase complex transferase subunit TsaD [Caulobacteraceae bacterium]
MTTQRLLVLGIETSCDETAAAVLCFEVGRSQVLSSVVASQAAEHAPFGGVVPEIAARAHVEIIDVIVRRALEEARTELSELSGIAATAGPGLVGGVMVGLAFAKAVALARGLPLLAVNHLEGHALSPRLEADFAFPYLLLLVSGGHCQLLSVERPGNCERLGSTLDDAAGEAFDKIGSALGLSYPAGPALEALARRGDPARFTLPRAMEGRASCDFSFSGLKTAAARLAADLTSEKDRADLSAAAQEEIARQLADRSSQAMALFAKAHPGKSLRFAVAGGVAANLTVRERLLALAEAKGFAFAAPARRWCTDNAAMIALAGAEHLALGEESPLDVPARPRWPLDEAAARLRPTHIPGRKGAKA